MLYINGRIQKANTGIITSYIPVASLALVVKRGSDTQTHTRTSTSNPQTKMEEDDPIVAEIPVHLAEELRKSMYVLILQRLLYLLVRIACELRH